MKLRRFTHGQWLAAFAFLLAVGWAVSRDLPPGGDLEISSITAEGTNIVLMATVPAGLSQVTLQMRSALDSPWSEAGTSEVPANGGNFSYTIAKPGTMAFFRLKGTLATNSAAPQSVTSSELSYVIVPPLGPESVGTNGSLAHLNEAVFHFKGNIDGSDKIVITREGAAWEHVNWQWPQGEVAVNRTKWNPRVKNYMTTSREVNFLPEHYSLESASLEVISGRGLVSLERGKNLLIVYLDDVENGSAEYEFKVRFPPVRPEPVHLSSPSATLKISAEVDGYEIFKITRNEATWSHMAWSLPKDVKLNGVVWPVQETDVLKNEGGSKYLTEKVDFSTARILSRKGRDVATMWADSDAVWVRFADNPNGTDYYELEIGFGTHK